MGVTKLISELTWSFSVPFTVSHSFISVTLLRGSLSRDAHRLCFDPNSSSTHLCGLAASMFGAVVEGWGAPAVCVFLPGEQTASWLCGDACVYVGFIDLSLVLQ